jgi:hypothetical protein
MKDDMVCIKINNSTPQFGKIDRIIEVQGKIFLSIIYGITRAYEQHLCAYHITMTNSKGFLNIEKLHHFMPLDLYSIQQKFFVAPKYNL